MVKGERVPLETGGAVEVLEEIGSGGQGEVYKVLFNGKQYALKWYASRKLKHHDKFRDNLRQNICDGPPSDDFLWPIYLTAEYKGNFGYLMDIRPSDFVDFSDILNNKKKFSNLQAVISCALNIVNDFRGLHRKGKSYQDLNDGNFFVNTETGDVLICDNDNIAPDKMNLGIGGKPGYMAPEIVRGEARPETLTDHHSLAVVLFKLFMRHDPLMGKTYVSNICITEEAEKRLYGDSPVFIFDPDDPSNRPVSGVHPNPIKLWPHYPLYIQDAFVTSFCKGMKTPASRLTDNEWQTLLIRLRGEILTCECGHETFAFLIKKQLHNNIFQCPCCKIQCSYPMVLNVKNVPVFLFPGNKVYKCHTEKYSDDYATEQGRVVQNKNNRSMWGLKNLSDMSWHYLAEGSDKVVLAGGVVLVREGVKLEFHQVVGEISRDT